MCRSMRNSTRMPGITPGVRLDPPRGTPHVTKARRLILVGVWTAGSLAALCAATPMRRPHDRLSYPSAARGSVVEQYHARR